MQFSHTLWQHTFAWEKVTSPTVQKKTLPINYPRKYIHDVVLRINSLLWKTLSDSKILVFLGVL